MITIEESLDFLGLKVRDVVTGFEGMATSVSFDLYGCVQVLLHPGLTADGKLAEQFWFDTSRLEVLGRQPVMERPQYESTKGPAEKPRCLVS